MPSIEGLASDEVFDLALEWIGEGRKVSIATVIETWGSAPRRSGSKLLVDSEGNFAGSVSGGCIENDVILEAKDAIGDHKHRELEYDVSDDDALGVGLACGGNVTVLVEPVSGVKADTIREIRERQRDRDQFAVLINLESGSSKILAPRAAHERSDIHLNSLAWEALGSNKPSVASSKGVRYFVEPFLPQSRLVIVGAVHISQTLVQLAEQMGYEPLVIDPRDSWSKEERFSGVQMHRQWPEEAFKEIRIDERTAVVTLTHDPKIDDPALVLALRSKARYVGALGSKRTHAKRVTRLKEEGMTDDDCERIDAPVGLDIGAATASEIALSIMSQVVRSFRSPWDQWYPGR